MNAEESFLQGSVSKKIHDSKREYTLELHTFTHEALHMRVKMNTHTTSTNIATSQCCAHKTVSLWLLCSHSLGLKKKKMMAKIW